MSDEPVTMSGSGRGLPPHQPPVAYMSGGSVPADDHLAVLLEAHQLYEQRNRVYKDVWKHHGLRGNLVKLRLKVERAWTTLWAGDQDEDDLLDVINYAAMCVRCLRDENRDGAWRWGDS
jgi:hypothetical protein